MAVSEDDKTNKTKTKKTKITRKPEFGIWKTLENKQNTLIKWYEKNPHKNCMRASRGENWDKKT